MKLDLVVPRTSLFVVPRHTNTRRPAACPRDPEDTKTSWIPRTSRGTTRVERTAAGRQEFMSRRTTRCLFLSFISLFLTLPIQAATPILNIYAWAGEIPDPVLRQFEKETGIKINFSTYENNEIMFAKIRATKNTGYDVLVPSGYFVDRMSKQQLLLKLDKTKLPNWKHLNPLFLHPTFDPNNDFSVPFLWSMTGIVYNQTDYTANSIKKWADLWGPRFYNKLMLLDDSREVFGVALLTLGYSINDRNPEHIKQAFLKLKELMQNVKVFSTDTVVSILIDEDATVGMAWNGDAYKASSDNPNIKFIYPEEGFLISSDNFSILVNAPHKDQAYAFLNFMLRPDIAKEVAMFSRYPIANLSAQKLLPESMRNNPMIYPSKEIMQRGQFPMNLDDKTLALYEKYWEELKMSG